MRHYAVGYPSAKKDVRTLAADLPITSMSIHGTAPAMARVLIKTESFLTIRQTQIYNNSNTAICLKLNIYAKKIEAELLDFLLAIFNKPYIKFYCFFYCSYWNTLVITVNKSALLFRKSHR